MTKPLLTALLALLVLAPAAAHAQAGAALGSPDADAIPEPPSAIRVVPAASGVDPEILALRAQGQGEREPGPRFEPLPQRDEADRSGPGFGASFGHASAGFGIGVGGGALLGGALTLALSCGNGDDFCVLFSMIGAGMGAATLSPFGAALGAWGFGERSGGTGNFFAALGGAYLGAGLGVGVGTLIGSLDASWALVLGPLASAILTTLGAAAGYQLTSHGGREEAASEVSIVPTFETVEGGATAGIAGTF